jgi:hypothetical protein
MWAVVAPESVVVTNHIFDARGGIKPPPGIWRVYLRWGEYLPVDETGEDLPVDESHERAVDPDFRHRSRWPLSA